MKKFLAILLTAALMVTLASCGASGSSTAASVQSAVSAQYASPAPPASENTNPLNVTGEIVVWYSGDS